MRVPPASRCELSIFSHQEAHLLLPVLALLPLTEAMEMPLSLLGQRDTYHVVFPENPGSRQVDCTG
jgi:hypothetical protein